MPLDPQAQVVLERLNLAGPPIDPNLLTPEAMRAGYEMMAASAPKESVSSVVDRQMPGPGGQIPVRIFTPAGEPPFPALVYFHGGGFVAGSVNTHDGTCRKLCNSVGCVVVSVDYRLAPEAKFPAAPEDCHAALRWVAEHAGEIDVDATRLAVGGDSAGGNLAAVVSLMARQRGGPALRHQLLIYPVINHDFETASYLANANGPVLSRATMIWFWKHYLPQESDALNPLASPLRAQDLRGLPPAFVITAELDPLCDEGEAYAARLREADVPVVCTRYEGMFHGFFSMSDEIEKAKLALAAAADGLRRSLAK